MKKSTRDYLIGAAAIYGGYYVARQGSLGDGAQDTALQLHRSFMALFGVNVDVEKERRAYKGLPDPVVPFSPPADATIVVNSNFGQYWQGYQQSIGSPSFAPGGPGPDSAGGI